MSWSIKCINNDVIVPESNRDEVCQELVAIRETDFSYEGDDVLDEDGRLCFNPDLYEHMDWVSDPNIQEVLKKYKVEGNITFGSLEGDNCGQFWGYSFDGKGGMRHLVGDIVFTPVVGK